MTNVSERDRWYLSWEVGAAVFALALGLLSSAALVASFYGARGDAAAPSPWELLGLTSTLPPLLASLLAPLLALLLGLAVGFLYGRLSLGTASEDERSFKEAYKLLNDVALWQLRSGGLAHVSQITDIMREAEASKLAALLARDKIWRISSQLDSEPLRYQLAATIGARRLRAWLSDTSPPPVGYEKTVKFRIEPFGMGDDETAATDGTAPAVESVLLVHVTSEQAEVKQSPVRIDLPASGPSSAAKVVVVAKAPGACDLSFLVYAEGTLELLQTYAATITVQPSAEGGTHR